MTKHALFLLIGWMLANAAPLVAEPGPSLKQLAASVRSSDFDPDEKIMSLDLEASRIIDFVATQVGYVSYAGSLRGIKGTLQSLRGNSLDQSLLLAHLLKQAGFDGRIVRAELDAQDRRRLVLGMDSLRTGQPGIDNNALRDSATHARFERALPQLAAARSALAKPVSYLPQLLKEAKDYFWVQYDIGEGWQDAHPAFGQFNPPDVNPAEYFAEEIPSSLVHMVRLQAFVQQRKAGEVIVLPITDAWQRPTGNLFGNAVTFALVPLGLNEKTASDLDGHLARSNFFAPMLNGSRAGSWVVDTKGNRIDAEAASSAGATLFKTLGDKMETAVVGVAPELEGGFALERIWFELVLSAPGTAERRLVRTIYDEKWDGPIIAAERADEPTKAPLFSTYHLSFDVGALAPQYLASRLIDSLMVSNEWLDFMLARGVEQKTKTPFPTKDISRTFSLLSQQTLQNALGTGDVLRYRAEPGVLGLRESYRGQGRFRISTDIINNRQRFLRLEGGDLLVDPDAALRHGVWETATEWLPRRLQPGTGAVSLNTIDYVEQLRSAGGRLKLVSEVEPGLPDSAVRDLRDGYWLLFPQTAATLQAYWRSDPQTGETLGMLSDGRGSELTEYLAQVVGISMTLANALSSLAQCEANGGNLAERACCIMNAHANTAFDMSYGNVVGALFGESAALIDGIARSQAQQAAGVASVNLMNCGNMQDYGDF